MASLCTGSVTRLEVGRTQYTLKHGHYSRPEPRLKRPFRDELQTSLPISEFSKLPRAPRELLPTINRNRDRHLLLKR